MSQLQRKEDGLKYFRIGGETYVAGPSDLLGKGTYGIVYRVHNERDASIKKAIKTFSPESMDENDGIPSTTLREINAMMTLDHPNVMKAQDVVFPKDGTMIDMFVVMELCKGTLKDKLAGLIQEHLGNDSRWTRPTQDMKLPVAYVKQAKIIAYQLLNALAVLHSRGIMHRDLKPVNIMWGFDDLLKLGDFGLARFVRGNQSSSDSVMPQTGEVQTMWYRAPEVLLGDERYGLKVDDWSIGCIIAEMFRFYRSSSGRIMASPLFAGKSDVETLLMIFDALGTPDPSGSPSGKYLETLPNWSKEYPKWTPSLKQRVQLIDQAGFDLLTQLLCTSPFDRQAAKFLLQHTWFDDVRQECKRFVPWYRGFEEGYKRMVAVNKLPRAQPLPTAIRQQQQQVTAAQDENQAPPANATTAAAAAGATIQRSVSGPYKVGSTRSAATAVSSTTTTTVNTGTLAPEGHPQQQQQAAAAGLTLLRKPLKSLKELAPAAAAAAPRGAGIRPRQHTTTTTTATSQAPTAPTPAYQKLIRKRSAPTVAAAVKTVATAPSAAAQAAVAAPVVQQDKQPRGHRQKRTAAAATQQSTSAMPLHPPPPPSADARRPTVTAAAEPDSAAMVDAPSSKTGETAVAAPAAAANKRHRLDPEQGGGEQRLIDNFVTRNPPARPTTRGKMLRPPQVGKSDSGAAMSDISSTTTIASTSAAQQQQQQQQQLPPAFEPPVPRGRLRAATGAASRAAKP